MSWLTLSDWCDWINSFDSKKNAKKFNEIEDLLKKVNEMGDFLEKGQQYNELIDLIESFEIFLWVDWVCSHVLSSMMEWIDIFKLYRFMVIESIPFHILPRLNWLFWHESYTGLELAQFCNICSYLNTFGLGLFSWDLFYFVTCAVRSCGSCFFF